MALIADGRVFEGQTYMFVNKAYPNRALNVWCSSSYPATNQSNVCLWTKDTTDTAQHWVIDRIAGNNYVLKSVENPQVYLDLYTGSGTGANSNAQLYEYEDDSDTCFLKFEAGGYSDTVHIKLAGTTNNGYFLTAYSDANGTRTGKSNTSAGNVFFQRYEIFDDRKEWIPVPIGTTSGGGDDEDDIDVGEQVTTFPTSAYYSSNNASYGFDPSLVGECTWYCNGRAYEKKGTNVCTRTARHWYGSATGFTKLDASAVPVADSIACFDGEYGHVVFVEKVAVENGATYIYFSECNWYSNSYLSNGQIETPPVGTDGQLKKLELNNFKNRGPGSYQGCIVL